MCDRSVPKSKYFILLVTLNTDWIPQPGRCNPELDKIVHQLCKIEYRGETAKIGEPLNPGLFIPEDSGYYTYQGSLTTPPCSECVIWVVFKEPIEVSEEQVRISKILIVLCTNLVPNFFSWGRSGVWSRTVGRTVVRVTTLRGSWRKILDRRCLWGRGRFENVDNRLDRRLESCNIFLFLYWCTCQWYRCENGHRCLITLVRFILQQC